MEVFTWIRWKFRGIKDWFLYFFLYRAFWKKLWVYESPEAYWEIVHDSEEKNVILHYVPEGDYSDNDVKIEIPYEHFEDLIKFMIKIR